MNIEQLEYIVKVAEAQSISTASESLHISQSGISMAITNLENELGIKVFKRSRLGTIPTEEGKLIIEKAYEVLGKLDEIRNGAHMQSDKMGSELRLSSTQGLFLTVLPKSLALFKKKYPDVNIIMEEKGGQEVIEDILNDKIDIGLMNIPWVKPRESELKFQGLMKTNVIVTAGRNSLLGSRKSITPKELLEHDLVIYNGPRMKTFIEEFFKRYGEINILFYTNNTEIIKKTVAEGLAFSFSYDIGIQNDPYFQSGELVAIPFESLEFDPMELGYVRSQKRQLSKASKEFLKCLEFYTSTM